MSKLSGTIEIIQSNPFISGEETQARVIKHTIQSHINNGRCGFEPLILLPPIYYCFPFQTTAFAWDFICLFCVNPNYVVSSRTSCLHRFVYGDRNCLLLIFFSSSLYRYVIFRMEIVYFFMITKIIPSHCNKKKTVKKSLLCVSSI